MSDTPAFGYPEQLQRALSNWDLLIYGMILMVPIAPMSIYGFVAQESHGMVALAYLIGMSGMLFTALSYATLSRAFPVAGSVYSYAQRGLHEAVGFLAGWLILLDYILVPALLYILSAVAMRAIWPAIPAWAWVLGFIAFNGFVNLRGVEFTARANRYMLVFELVTLLLFVIVGLAALHAGQGAGHLTLRPLYDPQVFSIGTVVGATSIAVLSFLGFDGISTMAEESKGGRDAVGRATVLSLLLVGLMFMVQTWIAADLGQGRTFADADSAFYEICAAAGGTWLKVLVIAAVAISAGIANAMAAQAAVSRLLFAMARDGRLPAVLARVHPRYRTPHMSTLLVCAVSVAASLVFINDVEDLTRLVNFGALCSFMVVHVTVIRHHYLRERSGNWLRHLLCPLLGMGVIGYVLVEMDATAMRLGIAWLGIGVAYYFVLTRVLRRPAVLEL